MCGLFGYAVEKQTPLLAQMGVVLAVFNANRGTDAWGVSDGKKIWKGNGSSVQNLFQMPVRNKGMLMGHTRAATVGAKTAANAHPWRFDKPDGSGFVIGAQNGHVRNWFDLNKQYKRELEVDSMQIFAHLAAGLPLSEIEGSGAITFFKDNNLFFSKFHGGQLAIARLKEGGILWSSDENHLRSALLGGGRTSQDYEFLTLQDELVYYYGPEDGGTLYETDTKIGIQRFISRVVTNSEWEGYHGMGGRGRYKPNKQQEKKVSALGEVKIRIRIFSVAALAARTAKREEETRTTRIREAITLLDGKWQHLGSNAACSECASSTCRWFDEHPLCINCSVKMVIAGKLILPSIASPPTPVQPAVSAAVGSA